MKVHHLGLIVDDITKSINIYCKLNYHQVSDIIHDNQQNNLICFMKYEDQTQLLELIQPIDKTSSIYSFDNGYHHICYEIKKKNFFKDFKKLKIGKIFSSPIIAPAIENKKVVFACLTNGTFVEFLLL